MASSPDGVARHHRADSADHLRRLAVGRADIASGRELPAPRPRRQRARPGGGAPARRRVAGASAGPTRRAGCWWWSAAGSGPSTGGSTGVATGRRARRAAGAARRARRPHLVRRGRRPADAQTSRWGSAATGSACAPCSRTWRTGRRPTRRWSSTPSGSPSGSSPSGTAPAAAAPLEPRAAGHEQICTSCGKATWPRTDPAVIMTVTHGEAGADDERCLLGRQAAWPEGRYSTLAGFVRAG